MTASTSTPAKDSDTLLLFGSQALSFNTDAFKELCSNLQSTSEQQWILEAIVSFPECWNAFVKQFPKYDVVERAHDLLNDMNEWFQIGSMESAFMIPAPGSTKSNLRLPNLVLSPLVVITHLVEYMKFLDINPGQSPFLGTLGFCTGVLSAFTVAVSKDRNEVRKYGAKALRLAMLIGGMVDAQEVLDASGPATALATAWSSGNPSGKEELEHLLRKSSEVNRQ